MRSHLALVKRVASPSFYSTFLKFHSVSTRQVSRSHAYCCQEVRFSTSDDCYRGLGLCRCRLCSIGGSCGSKSLSQSASAQAHVSCNLSDCVDGCYRLRGCSVAAFEGAPFPLLSPGSVFH